MINKIGLPLFSTGLFAVTVLFAPCAANAAQRWSAATIEFSAQQQQEHKGKPQKAAPAARPAQPRVAPQRAAPQRSAPRVAAPHARRHVRSRSRKSRHAQSRATESYIAHGHATERYIAHGQSAKSYNASCEATQNCSEDGRSGRRSQGGITRCRSACCHTACEDRHHVAPARGSDAAPAELSFAARIIRVA